MVFLISSFISFYGLLFSSPFSSFFHRLADFIKGFANRITIEMSIYYAEYSIVFFNLNFWKCVHTFHYLYTFNTCTQTVPFVHILWIMLREPSGPVMGLNGLSLSSLFFLPSPPQHLLPNTPSSIPPPLLRQ